MRIFLACIFFVLVTSMEFTMAQSATYWHGKERELRYSPQGLDFVIVNGNLKYNRALYGTNTAFRVETSDTPEFGLFMPNMGGNIQVGIIFNNESFWLSQAATIKSIYRAGTRIYEITDPKLSLGMVAIQVLAMSDADGMIMKIEGADLPANSSILCSFGGANNQRFSRNGDLGVDIKDAFDLQPDACLNNDYSISNNTFLLHYGQTTKTPQSSMGVFPLNTVLKTSSPFNMYSPIEAWNSTASDQKPILLAKLPGNKTFTHYILIKNDDGHSIVVSELEKIFIQSENKRREIAQTVQIETPDPFINPLGSILSTATDGIWDKNWLHGAIGWRMPLNGWRAAYTGDVIGWHDRARIHFDSYAASQITHIEPVIPHPTQDSALNLARALKKWGTPMYSNGYICRNPNDTTSMHHYDMNLCYIDELLWHLNWTGDLDYARTMWPVIARHLAWEKRNFDPNDDGLYDAYAGIWASDALYYNSGGVTHASAYNYRANRMAAQIASKIGMNPQPYDQEANKIQDAVNARLWMKDVGCWAEFQDLLGHQYLHTSPGIWTIYHAIDSDIHTPFQAYQATRYIDTEIPHIPVRAKGLPDDGYYTISTTNWLPYSWSINNVAIAEVGHTSLAYWQAGRYDEAYKLFKSSVLDGMYLGSSPGNIGQVSFYDAARGECYRDFGDPVGIYSRVLIQGLFGILPDMMNHRLVIKPGFPSNWDHASIETSDIHFSFKREKTTDYYHIENHLGHNTLLELQVKATHSSIKQIRVNGVKQPWKWINAIGAPMIQIECTSAEKLEIQIEWSGDQINQPFKDQVGVIGETFTLKSNIELLEVYDPQHVLSNGALHKNQLSGTITGVLGSRTLFVKVKQGDATWWKPIALNITEPVTVIPDSEGSQLQFALKNNRLTNFTFDLLVNPGFSNFRKSVTLKAGQTSEIFVIPTEESVLGTNQIVLQPNGETIFETTIENWNLQNPISHYEMVDIDGSLNASVEDIFKQQYLSPRSPFTTLQIPTQGIGEWCHPLLTANIDDSGLRKATQNRTFSTPMGIPFRSVADSTQNNIVFTSLWDNYPTHVEIPLTGKASHAYMLMAGTTNHMQCHLINGTVTVCYTDGSHEVLNLINPDNWVPIEQDLYIDEYAFKVNHSRPYRVAFKQAIVTRDLQKVLRIKPEEVYGRSVDGGAGIILDLPLNASKTLKSLCVETMANEVIVGLMSLTLVR